MDILPGGASPQDASAVPARRRTRVTKVLTKSEITAQAIKMMTWGGYECWRQNNARTRRGYVFQGLKGVSDILGFNRFTALFMVCEVKTVSDSLRPEQIVFLTKVTNAGGIALIATQDEKGNVILVQFKDYLLK